MARVKDQVRRIGWGIVFTIGFALSPVSWWNDAVVNIPTAYLTAHLLALIDQRIFSIAFVGMYWITNLIGMALMHIGAKKLLVRAKPKFISRRSLLISIFYTLLIVVLAQFKFIHSPFAELRGTGTGPNPVPAISRQNGASLPFTNK